MIRIAILDDYHRLSNTLVDWSGLSGRAVIDVFDRNLTVEEAKLALEPYDIVCLMRERMPFPADLIYAMPRLKFIAVTGRQNRTLDMAAVARRNIVVSYSFPIGGGAWDTAELAWGLLLAMARNIPAEDAALRRGGWQTRAGIGLHGKTLGLVGLGRIGKQVAHYGKAFGMTVQAWSPNLTPERAAEAGVMAVSKSELFGASDAVSLHLVLGERTMGVIGRQEIESMKPQAILVNTARAELVVRDAMFESVKAGRIRLAMDVFPSEPLAAGNPYTALPNTVLTPHLGYVTHETMAAFYRGTLETVEAFLRGSPIRVLTE
jgi:phosphoglycerate dehydrogenase-like enzyme